MWAPFFNLPIYIVTIILCMLGAGLFRKWDRVFSLLIVVVMFGFAAFRRGGYDYDQYIEMVRVMHNIDLSSFGLLFLNAKDPVFGAIVWIIGIFSAIPEHVFYFNILLAVLLKLIFAFKWPRNGALFLGFYAIFLSPGLEFAAVRTAVALGFFCLAIQWAAIRTTRYLSMILAILSHISILPVVLLGVSLNRPRKSMKWAFFLLLAVGGNIIFSMIGSLPITRGSDYVGATGTWISLLPPLLNLAILMFSFPGKQPLEAESSRFCYDQLIYLSIALTFISIGTARPVAVVSGRILEIVWFLMLVVFIRSGLVAKNRKTLVGFIAFLISIGISNIQRDVWGVFARFDLGF